MEKKAKKQNKEKVIDASGKVLGRLASEVAVSLIGKDKASYERHNYSGSPVKVLNVSKIKITPKKLDNITHLRYTGHRGGLRSAVARETVAKKGFKELLRLSVYRMLPSNKLRREMMKNLKIEE